MAKYGESIKKIKKNPYQLAISMAAEGVSTG
jgi:hypothetical protein